MPDTTTDWVGFFFDKGVLGAFAVAVALVVWYKILPWGERYISSTEKLHDVLQVTQAKQIETCESHIASLGQMATMIDETVKIGITARDQASVAASLAAEGNKSLSSIDHTLTGRTQLLIATAHGVSQLKAVALSNCEMCRKVAQQLSTQFPSVAAEIGPHCDAIKKKLEETA